MSIDVKKELFFGAPGEQRENVENESYTFLENLGIEFFRADHERADTIEACLAVEEVLGCEICKNLLLCNSQKTSFYMLLMPGNKPFKTKDLSKQIGSARLSFADGEAMERLVSIKPGSLSVLGLIFDKDNSVRLLIDRELTANEFIGCHPCMNTSTLKIKTADILEKFLPAVGHEATFVDLPRYE